MAEPRALGVQPLGSPRYIPRPTGNVLTRIVEDHLDELRPDALWPDD